MQIGNQILLLREAALPPSRSLAMLYQASHITNALDILNVFLNPG